MRRSLVLALCVAGLACLAGCPVPQPQNTPVEPKLLAEPVNGGSYYLYVPSTYRRNLPAPVIVTCHGTDPFDVAAHQVGEWKMLAERYGCILVCPKLTSTDGILAGALDQLLNDERTIMSIVGQLHYRYNIDRANVLMTGFSGGGFPAYFVGLRHPDVFTTVVARNANFNRHALEDWYPPEALRTPLMIYWGENDVGSVVGQSEAAVAYCRGAGFKVETAVVAGSGHDRHPEVAMGFWLKHWNGQAPAERLAADLRAAQGNRPTQ